MKVSYKTALEVYRDLNLGSINKNKGSKVTQEDLFTAAKYILKDQNVLLNEEPTETVRIFVLSNFKDVSSNIIFIVELVTVQN